MHDASKGDPRRALPSVDQLLQEPPVRALQERFGRALVTAEARAVLAGARARAAGGGAPGVAGLAAEVAARLASATAPSLVRVINATGVVIHTNLGRAPLPEVVARRVADLAAGYTNLEMDLATGERGEREAHAEGRLRAIAGAPAALAVNNNAAAVLLAVNTFAEGLEVIVSRGELVEIGGSFRIPDVLRKSGAVLREVGTTNRTRAADYRAALGSATGMILKVHPSNFHIVGFTETPSRAELAAVAAEAKVPLVEDLGSGLLAPLPPPLDREESVAASLSGGVDVVTFSGDKLLGGPQAGVAAGKATAIRAMRTNPLYRALRLDKMTLAALDGILREYQEGRAAGIPAVRMLSAPADALLARAESFRERVEAAAPGARFDVVEGSSAVGGGAAPAVEIPTALVRVRHRSQRAHELARRLRLGAPAVVARIVEDAVVLDLRTVDPAEEDALLAAVAAASAS